MNSLELAAVSSAETALGRIGKSWETNWVPVGQGFLALRTFCMRINRTNSPKGRGYNTSYSAALSRHPHLAAVNQVVRKALLDCMENIGEITEWREGLALEGEIAWHSPRDVWKQFNIYKNGKPVQVDKGGQAPPPAKLTKDDQIRDLEEKLDAYKQVGDVQLCKKDSAKDNARVLVHTFPEDKLKEIVKAILIGLDVPPEIEKKLREEARVIARQKRSA